MIRPIDTQTIYQQTQEVANKQHAYLQKEQAEQMQFSQIMHKETEIKQESINKLEKEEKIDNDLNKKKKEQDQLNKNKQKQKKKEKSHTQQIKESKIDIRI